ncbi:hypothetical protein BLNAU_17642 [Blattamonas nauphoetae]|uniref:Uncharacterized protein n=1 Tax=Blattamonas nauphoetae TaxID=2049346 RepID=A0ABQ9XAS7_9EUKA|nr:hypothetical protein BLNAU_17642 [Blattamonas nauphoetae]
MFSNLILVQTLGRSTQIDQEYFGTHITKTPETIRPLHVLRLSFKSAMDKHNTDAEYSIVNDLLQGIRQDLLIQRIKNPFSIAVNETHAKLSLRHNDLSEFRRCMTNLLDDYAVEWQIQSNPPIYQTTPISPPRFKDDLSPLMQEPSFLTEHTPEMVHLHILFLCMIGHYTQIQNLLTQLPPILASTYLISHAVSIVQTQRIGNWTRFSRLRTQFRDKFGADNPNFILLTLIQRNNNSVALHALMQSSRPTLPLPSLLHHLRIDKSVLTALIEQNAITVKNDAIECQAECSKLEKAKTLIQFDATGMDIRPVSDQSQKVAKTVGQKNTTFEAMKRKL